MVKEGKLDLQKAYGAERSTPEPIKVFRCISNLCKVFQIPATGQARSV